MSLLGKANPGQFLTGKINKVTFQIITAYGLAVKNGFKGTEEEWLQSLAMSQKEVEEAVYKYLSENPVAIDPSLSVEGEAADAKATGDAILRIIESLGEKVNESSLPEVINTALAEAKASGAFDGKDGQDGQNGQDGKDGQDGYTPVRGTDYWTASDVAEIKSYVDEAILGGVW